MVGENTKPADDIEALIAEGMDKAANEPEAVELEATAIQEPEAVEPAESEPAIDGEAVEVTTQKELTEEPEGPALDEVIKELQEKYKPEEAESPKQQLAAQALEIQKIINAIQAVEKNPYDGLPQFVHNGKLIYQLNRQEMDEYVTNLNDKGQAVDAAEALAAYQKFQGIVSAVNNARAVVAQKEAQYAEAKWTHDWAEAEAEFKAKLPIDAAATNKLIEFISARINSSDTDLHLAQTPAGKRRLIHEALQQTGVYDQLRKQQQTEGKADAPTVPDVRVKSKSVKPQPAKKIWTRAEIAKLTPAQYAEHEADIDEAMVEGRIQ